MINDYIEEFKGIQSPFFGFSGEKRFLSIFYRRKNGCQAAEGITVYTVKAPLKKTTKNRKDI